MKFRGRNPALYCVLSAVVFSLSACNVGGGTAGGTGTALIIYVLRPSSAYVPPNTVATGYAAAAVQVLNQNGMAVLDYWCATLVYPPSTFSAGVQSAIVVVASVPATDAAMINHSQRPDPFAAFNVYDQRSSSLGLILGAGFNCASNGW